MLIAVIGMDNTGKTTLVERLHKELALVKVKSPGPNLTEEEKIEGVKNLMKYSRSLARGGKSPLNIVTDRFMPFEELVYGKVLRNLIPPLFNLDSDLMREIKDSQEVLVIYARPPLSTILDWKDREQMERVVEKALVLIREYDHLALELGARGWMVYQYSYNLKNRGIDFMIKHIKEVLDL